MIAKLEKKLLEIMYKDYVITKQRKVWELPASFEIFGIGNGEDISVINDSKYIVTKGNSWQISTNGIRFMENISKPKKEWKVKIEEGNLWANSAQEGKDVHMLIGSREDKDVKIHFIHDLETGEIRIDRKDSNPEELIKEITTLVKFKDQDEVLRIVKGNMQFISDESLTRFDTNIKVSSINASNQLDEVDQILKDLQEELDDPSFDSELDLSYVFAELNNAFYKPKKETLTKYKNKLLEYREKLIELDGSYFIEFELLSSKYDEFIEIEVESDNINLKSKAEFLLELPKRPSLKRRLFNTQSLEIPYMPDIHEVMHSNDHYRSNYHKTSKGFGIDLKNIKKDQRVNLIPLGGLISTKTIFPITFKIIVNSKDSGGDFEFKSKITKEDVGEISYEEFIEK